MPILLAVTTIANLVYSVLRQIYIRRTPRSVFGTYILATTGLAFLALLVAVAVKGAWRGTGITVLLGIAYGVVTLLQYMLTMRALSIGSYSFTMLIMSFSAVIPSFSGLIWGEKVGVLQIIGLVLMLVFFTMLVLEKKQRPAKGWLVICVVILVLTGLLGVLQKWHQNSVGAAERDLFLLIAFGVVFVGIAGCMLGKKLVDRYTRREQGAPVQEETVEAASEQVASPRPLSGWQLALIIVVSGAGLLFNNVLNLYLVGAVRSAFFFPLINGLNVVLNTLCGVLLFQERLSARLWLGIVIGVVAIVLVCLP